MSCCYTADNFETRNENLKREGAEREFIERMNLFIQFQLVSPQTDVCIIVLPYCKRVKVTECFILKLCFQIQHFIWLFVEATKIRIQCVKSYISAEHMNNVLVRKVVI